MDQVVLVGQVDRAAQDGVTELAYSGWRSWQAPRVLRPGPQQAARSHKPHRVANTATR